MCNDHYSIICLTSLTLFTILPRAKDYLTTFDRGTLAIRDLRLCGRLAIGHRFLSREVAAERGGRRSETPISRFPGPGVRQWYRRRFVARKWEWKWPVGWIRFFDRVSKNARIDVCVCFEPRTEPTHDIENNDPIFSSFFFSLKSPLVQSRNSIGNFLSPASLSPISVTPPHSPLVHSTTLSAFHESGVITWEESTFDQSHSF